MLIAYGALDEICDAFDLLELLCADPTSAWTNEVFEANDQRGRIIEPGSVSLEHLPYGFSGVVGALMLSEASDGRHDAFLIAL
jgi:hypothetical protein